MKILRKTLYLVALIMTIQLMTPVNTADAQCAMCSLTAQNATENGNTQGNGLNNGIMYLLAMPYLAALAMGVLWYTKYRSKKEILQNDDPIQMN